MRNIILQAAAAILVAGAAHAATEADATTDLALRAGPGPKFEVLGVIPAGDLVMVEGCLESADWCEVRHNGTPGWAHAAYMAALLEDEPVALAGNLDALEVRTVSDSRLTAAGDTTATEAEGEIAGRIAAPDAEAAQDAAEAVEAEALPLDIMDYVEAHPAPPVFLDGEVVAGADLPEDIPVQTLPEGGGAYARINGVPVLLSSDGRRVDRILH